jgi:hypothetical protein
MARAIAEIEEEIRALSTEEKRELLRTLIAELDAPSDPDVEREWLNAAQRRYGEIAEGRVQGVPGPFVFKRLRSRLGQ